MFIRSIDTVQSVRWGWGEMRPCVHYIGEMRLKIASKKCEEMRLQRVKCVHASTATSEMRANKHYI